MSAASKACQLFDVDDILHHALTCDMLASDVVVLMAIDPPNFYRHLVREQHAILNLDRAQTHPTRLRIHTLTLATE